MSKRIDRRRFLQTTGVAAGLAGAGFTLGPRVARGADSEARWDGKKIALIVEPADPVVSAPLVEWATGQLRAVLLDRGVNMRICRSPDETDRDERCIVLGSVGAGLGRAILENMKVSVPSATESLAFVPGEVNELPSLLACGFDSPGVMYAVLELAERVQFADDVAAALDIRRVLVEQPANKVRGIGRAFASDREDLPWFHDQGQWRDYFTMLARQRFNRFTLHLGLGYDFTREIRDSYFHFPYPFLVSPPGHNVRAVGLSNDERAKNLTSLKFMSDQAGQRGIEFWLALWTHAYEFTDSPQLNYRFDGLSPANHAAYCRDALAALLDACPGIRGVTIRTHGESGVAEGSDDFWKVVFEGFKGSRKVGIDLHPKGLDQRMIDTALATGMPVQVSPKFWAEHMGLPYHQASIRELEIPPREKQDTGFFAKSGGSRRFLRYGYGDLLTENRPYEVVYRIWPGTQRMLLWGDPEAAAAYSRQGSFCGSQGIEVFEPLTFKGKKGTGQEGSRTGYKNPTLLPERDWEKFDYTFRVWGRALYNPDSDPETWRRALRKRFGMGTEAAEAALAAASRILPLVTTVHLPSAANNNFWPEMYQNMSLVDEVAERPYKDTPKPKRFGTVSPLDPTLFYGIEEFAADLSAGRVGGRYTPFEVAAWLSELSERAGKQCYQALRGASGRDPEARRWIIDISIMSALGQFFAHKLRAGVLYAVYQSGSSRSALAEAIKEYRAARRAWFELDRQVEDVYVEDTTFGPEVQQRGTWSDRLPAIDVDLAALEKLAAESTGNAAATAELVIIAPQRPSVSCQHAPSARFKPGETVLLELAMGDANDRASIKAVRLHYRHVNQAERWQSAELQDKPTGWQVEIPAAYTRSDFPLQYFFELRNLAGHAWLYPGLEANLCNQPYFVVRQG